MAVEKLFFELDLVSSNYSNERLGKFRTFGSCFLYSMLKGFFFQPISAILLQQFTFPLKAYTRKYSYSLLLIININN